MPNFRVTWRSMLALAVFSVGIAIFIFSFREAIAMLVDKWNIDPRLLVFERSLEYLLFAIVPFRRHIGERPQLLVVTLGVSFVARYITMSIMYGALLHWQIAGIMALQHALAAFMWAMAFLAIHGDEVPAEKSAKNT